MAAKQIALLTVHGMGETSDDYAQSLQTLVTKKLAEKMDLVEFRPIYYQDLLQKNEEAVWNSTRKAGDLNYEDFRKFILYGIADAAGLENGKECDGSMYEKAQLRIARHLWAAREVIGNKGSLFVIAQSLGCQVFSSYVYDAQKATDGRAKPCGIWREIDSFASAIKDNSTSFSDEEKSFLSGNTLTGLVTTGCNIPIFVAAHEKMSIKPISKPRPDFQWHNYYDPDDVLGWPLQPLSAGYKDLVTDHRINSGRGLVKWLLSWTPLSHSAYWEDDDVVDPLVKMLRGALKGN